MTTYCVAFTGDGISGDEALRRAGRTFGQGGGGSGRTVCSIDQVGCFNVNPNDFNTCFCQCTTSDCTYWAFFTRAYGRPWAYSGLAFNLIRAKDGDVHGWKWGKGSPSSAPAPREVTFEQVCGHAPQGGPSPPTATAAPATAAPVTIAPNPTQAPQPPAAGATQSATAAAPPSGTPADPSPTAFTPLPPTAGPQAAVITLVPLTQTPPPTALAPAAGDLPQSGDGDRAQLLGFGLVATALLAAIGGGLWWRRTHGA